METILGKIVADKCIWVEERKKQQPLETFKHKLEPSDRRFFDALSTKQTAFIMECKKASPSKGLIRKDFNLEEIAHSYAPYASAVSVLCDEKYFQGSFDFLPIVRDIVPCPVLCKDFMVDPYQIYLARHYGADAILLMLSVLNDNEYRMMAEVANSLNLGILTETSNQQEMDRAVALGAEVIGINNRDLRDLSIDLNRTRELAPQIPSTSVAISESGIYTHAEVKELSSFVGGFLIGSSLMGETNLEQAVKAMALGQNKVCGLTREEDAQHALSCGAIFGGLIFALGSKRTVSIEQAQAVQSGAELNYVGVFQNQSQEQISQVAKQLNLHAVQLHGDEDQAYIDALKPQLAKDTQVWKAVAIDEEKAQLLAGLEETTPEQLFSIQADRYVLDTKVGNQSGGTGKTFDWSLLANWDKSKIMLAGGITPENAQQASQVGCIGLDINSGVESAPGIKDAHKLQQAFIALREY